MRPPSLARALRTAAIVFALVLSVHVHGPGAGEGVTHAVAENGLMTAAMMLPLAWASAALVAERSLRSRRRRAVVEHVTGFGAVWFLFGMGASAALRALHELLDPSVLFAMVAGAALGWQLSARRRVAADRCGYVHVGPPGGWRCDVHTIAAGALHAIPCLRTCGAAMAAMVAAPHPLVMAALFAAYLTEWAHGANPFASARRTRPVPAYAVVAVGAVVAAAL